MNSIVPLVNHPVVRRKSAAERLAESKYKYIKSPVTPLLDRDVNTTAHRTVQKSLSAGVKPSVLVLTQSQPVHPSIDVPDHHEIPQSLKSPSAHPVLHTSSTLPNISSSAQLQPQPVIIRKTQLFILLETVHRSKQFGATVATIDSREQRREE